MKATCLRCGEPFEPGDGVGIIRYDCREFAEDVVAQGSQEALREAFDIKLDA